jgi:cysteine-S-conjugate beta-lyase
MKYDFDKMIHRRNSNSVKWDMGKYAEEKMLPMWVADMDFQSPPEIIKALHERVDHGVFGYTFQPKDLENILVKRLKKLYNWKIKSEWIVWLPGLVTGFNIACRAFADINEDIATTVPVYYPFLNAPKNNNQTLTAIPLKKENNRWTLDFEAIDKAIKAQTKIFLFCNPHNPGGTIFTKDELLQFAKICEKHDLIICSDEIHCDLILNKNKKHIPIASLSPEIAKRTITLMAPSKTYNIAGMGCSFAIISDKKLKEKYDKTMAGIVPHVSLLGYTAALAAYKDGNEWLEKMLEYIRGNYNLIKEFVDKTPGLSMVNHEATYLAWIDTKETGIENPALFFENAHVGVSDGAPFGGSGFIRMNFGCQRSVIIEALKRIDNALSNRLKK